MWYVSVRRETHPLLPVQLRQLGDVPCLVVNGGIPLAKSIVMVGGHCSAGYPIL